METVKERYNNTWLGIAVGIVFPMVCFFGYWLFAHNHMEFPRGFIRYLLIMESLGNTLKLCTIANLLMFYLFLNKKKNNTVKGIIIGTLVYLVLIIYLTFFVETTV